MATFGNAHPQEGLAGQWQTFLRRDGAWRAHRPPRLERMAFAGDRLLRGHSGRHRHVDRTELRGLEPRSCWPLRAVRHGCTPVMRLDVPLNVLF